ncbi:MAG: response regulator receiver protein [Desulfovibrio sp. S3730MH75]|nr:MAG: response regulator receiver protein [Desulfovibrio sp. S3730MH75]
MKKILIIDDDPKMRDLLKHYLKEEPATLLTAPDGEVGVQLFADHEIDLIIIDIFMPNMDGIQTIIEIKQKKADSKILVISGGGEYTGLEYIKQAKALGAEKALVKPFTKDDFLKTVNSMLG